jgi:hypothetical protein
MTSTPPQTLAIEPDSAKRPGRLRRFFKRLDRIFVLTVAVPTALAILYYGGRVGRVHQ